MTAANLAFLSITDLVERLRRREVSAVEVVTAQLDRIAALDTRLNAYITVLADQARAEAARADDRLRRGESAPLLGVPVAVKDLVETAGVRTTGGARILASNVPDRDATVVRRLGAAGAIVLGKTNMMEFAYGYPHPDFGETRNPWSLERTAGGSSGGSAAAVAAGMAYGALGSDTGGSIRSPASYCGIVGLKPTYGLVSRHGVLPLAWSLDHVGPLTRTAADAALMLDVIAGYDPLDPAAARVDAGSTRRASTRDVRGLRVGVVEAFFDRCADPDVRAVARGAVEQVAALGVELDAVSLTLLDLVVPAITPIVQAEAASYHWANLVARPDDYSAPVRDNLRIGATILAKDYLAAQRTRRLITDEIGGVLDRFDALVFPTQPIAAPRLDAYRHTSPDEEDILDVEIAYTGLANLTGHPAVSVPCGFTSAGLPVGLQFTGRYFDEATILSLAAAFEAATPWAGHHPPLAPDLDPREPG